MSRAPLAFLRGRKDSLYIEPVLRGLALANLPDFVNDWIPRSSPQASSSGVQITGHSQPSLQIAAKLRVIMAFAMCTQIPGYQEVHAVYCCDRDVRGIRRGLSGNLTGLQNSCG